MTQDDLGPKPDAEIEPGETNPGGADAVDAGDPAGDLAIPDLTSDENPAIDDKDTDALDEMKQGEDTSTQATDDDEKSVDAEKESPA